MVGPSKFGVLVLIAHSMHSDNRLHRLFLKSERHDLQFFLRKKRLFTELVGRGLSNKAASRSAGLFLRTAQRLCKSGANVSAKVSAFWVPGRIEVLGKHTDYAGGLSIVAALEYGVAVLSVPAKGSKILVFDALSGSTIIPGDTSKTSGWAAYPDTVWKRLQQNFDLNSRGLSISFASNLIPAAGMSSSSALVVAMYLALHDHYCLGDCSKFETNIHSLPDLADYLGHIENGQSYRSLPGEAGVGTFGGSQDHSAILCAQAGSLSLFSFLPTLHLEDLAVPKDIAFCIATSGVRAVKTGDAKEKYNRNARLVSELCRIWKDRSGKSVESLAALFHEPGFSLKKFDMMLDWHPEKSALKDRLLQSFEEIVEIIPAAVEIWKAGELDKWGRIVDRSQWLAEQLLKNQVPETIFLAAEARRLGALAASSFGAGYGGSVWAMVDREKTELFLEYWGKAYFNNFPQHAETATFFKSNCGPGVVRVA